MSILPKDVQNIEELEATVARNAAQLKPHEIRWRDKQQFLEKHGYLLRPRLRPGWVPSWIINGKTPDLQEDFYALPPRYNLVDGTHISDGRPVYIKRVETGKEEIEIASYFCQPPHNDDPRNHCVPILESFQDDQQSDISYIVMPFLRSIDDPPFYFVRDVVDCVDQLLEGLVFVHEHHVAHRDCSPRNLMMDASSMFPRGHHPYLQHMLADMSGNAPFVPRPAARPPVKYFYVDFGISSKFQPDEDSRLVLGTLGRDQDVPELSDSTPYDPFKVDVFLIGNVLRKEMHDKYKNVGFLLPLIKQMTQRSPRDRPTAVQSLEAWRKVRKGIWFTARRVHEYDESLTESIVSDVHGFFEIISALSQRLFRKPRRA